MVLYLRSFLFAPSLFPIEDTNTAIPWQGSLPCATRPARLVITLLPTMPALRYCLSTGGAQEHRRAQPPLGALCCGQCYPAVNAITVVTSPLAQSLLQCGLARIAHGASPPSPSLSLCVCPLLHPFCPTGMNCAASLTCALAN